jgi:hypothetical protein
MTQDQRIVLVGAASGVTIMIAAVAVLYWLWPVDPRLADRGSRLAYSLQAAAFAALPLLISIMAVGNNRFLTEAIDPTLHKENLATVVNGRVADNTLQQFALFFAATLALSVNLTASGMRVIPAVTIVFMVARFVFWIGYRIHPLYRAPGMAATGFLNVGLLGLALYEAAFG